MIYQLTSIKTVIFKIINDLGIGDKEVNWQDWVEWMADGLNHIGAHYQFTEKEEELPVEDFKAYLPCDFYKKIRLFDKSTNYYLNTNENLIGTEKSKLDLNKFTNSDYNINHNTITVAFQTGTLVLQYLAMPLDEDQLPMVPDDVSYRDALFWKVVYHLSIRGYEFKNPQLRDINFTRSMWNKYCMQARASANMPDLESIERLKNNWLRLKPDVNQYGKLFSTNGNKENLHLRGKDYYNTSK